jgi:hypothetical protein
VHLCYEVLKIGEGAALAVSKVYDSLSCSR